MAQPSFVPSVFDALRLTAVSLDVSAVQRLGAVDIRARQASRLRSLVKAARERSPLWRELLPPQPCAAAGQIDLAALPVVSKTQLMQRFDEGFTDPAIRQPELRAFLDDPKRVGEPFLGRYIAWESSGTSGEPGMFVQDAQAMAVYDALEALRRHTLHPLQRMLDPLYLNERVAFVGATGGHFASVVSVERLRRLNPWMGVAFHSLSILRPTAELVAELNALAPTVLATYPTAVALLAEQARAGALRIRPTEIWTGGETLTGDVRHHVERTFGCKVRNSYGASEFLSIGWECAQGRMHANTDWVILEPVDAQHRPVAPGEASHSMLLTNLANHVQPLIRYDLGDSLRIEPEPCACGSPSRDRRPGPPRRRAGVRRRCRKARHLAAARVVDAARGRGRRVRLPAAAARRAHAVPARRLGGRRSRHALARCHATLANLARRDGLHGLRFVEEPGVPPQHGSSGKVRRVIAAKLPAHRRNSADAVVR